MCLLNVVSSVADEITFKHLAMQKQLSNYSVMALYQDERGLLWIGTRYGVSLYDGSIMETYRNNPSDSHSIISNSIRDIVGDKKGSIYFLTLRGISKYSINKEKFETLTEKDAKAITFYEDNFLMAYKNELMVYDQEQKTFSTYFKLSNSSAVISDFEFIGDSIFIGTESHGLYIYNKQQKELSHPIQQSRVSKIVADSKGNTWIGTWKDGAYRIHGNEIAQYTHNENDEQSICSNFVRTFCEDNLGNLWIGTFKGVSRYNKEQQSFESYAADEKSMLTNSSVWSMLCDSQGTIWVGTYFGGVNYFNPMPEVKKYFPSNANPEQRITVGAMTEDKDGNLWICTEGEGLCQLNIATGSTKWYRHNSQKNSISQNNLKSIYFDEKENSLWIGTHLNGLDKLDLATEKFTHYVYKDKEQTAYYSNIVSDIIPYKDNLILATHNGVYFFNKKTGEFSARLKSTEEHESIDFAFDLEIDSDGILWIAGDKKGLFSYNFEKEKLTQYSYNDDKNKISGNGINCMYQDSQQRLWICTGQTGIDLYDRTTQSFINLNEAKDGLLSNCVYGACEIAPDKLIFIMENGFSYLDYTTKKIRNFMVNDNIPLKAINQNAVFTAKNGDVFIGGVDGMISFSPKYLEHTSKTYQIFPLKMYLNDQEVKVNDETNILKEALSTTPKITLTHKQSMFSIVYSVTNFLPYAKDEIVYKLENFSDTWSTLRDEHYITYTNLNPGKYKLIVKSKSKENACMPSVLEIEVLPPWYKTYWAFLLLSVVLLVIVSLVINIYKNRLKLQTELEYERKHIKYIEDMNRMKLQFFTNISHEFRTPLTLIIGEIELLLQIKSFQPSTYNRILNVYKSSMQLQTLISELLDFRKQEQGHMHIKASCHNIVKFLEENYLLFKEYALTQNINFTFLHESNNINLYYDSKQIQKVINNLLSNAFKHTPKHGTICLKITEDADNVTIIVSDTGKGIKKEDLKRIFERFYQTDDTIASSSIGVGIGLALTKGIVELHHGSIHVESEVGKGTTFTINLLKGDKHFNQDEIKTGSSEEFVYHTDSHLSEITAMEDSTYIKEDENKKFKVLLVEDDTSLLNLLQQIFEPYYDVYVASNGDEALKVIKENQPHLILSDIQMPGMSGLELCKKIKRNIDTCHIPVVLLTARTALEHKLEGFNTGADDYIMKPFETNILLARCRNLINNRLVLQEKFTKQPQVSAQAFATNELDKQFIDKAMKIIEDNLNNPEFSTTLFAQEMAIARTNLFVKIKAITGQTPNELIATVRLKRAAYLLKNNIKLSIAEIAESTGFTSPRYFSRCFKERYKESPHKYRKDDDVNQVDGAEDSNSNNDNQTNKN